MAKKNYPNKKQTNKNSFYTLYKSLPVQASSKSETKSLPKADPRAIKLGQIASHPKQKQKTLTRDSRDIHLPTNISYYYPGTNSTQGVLSASNTLPEKTAWRINRSRGRTAIYSSFSSMTKKAAKPKHGLMRASKIQTQKISHQNSNSPLHIGTTDSGLGVTTRSGPRSGPRSRNIRSAEPTVIIEGTTCAKTIQTQKISPKNLSFPLAIHGQNDTVIILGDGITLAKKVSEGIDSVAVELGSHAEGQATQAEGKASHSEGTSSRAGGLSSHAEGTSTYAEGTSSHAENNSTVARGSYTHAEGNLTLAEGLTSHAEGDATHAKGISSHAAGNSTFAEAHISHAHGIHTVASFDASTVVGKYGTTKSNSLIKGEGSLQIAGGEMVDNKADGISVMIGTQFCGLNPMGGGLADFWRTSGADYAEFFEWADGNPNAEDRIGLFVKLNGDKITISDNSSNTIGVVGSIRGTSGYISDGAYLSWKDANMVDDYGRRLTYFSYSATLSNLLIIHNIVLTTEIQDILGGEENETMRSDLLDANLSVAGSLEEPVHPSVVESELNEGSTFGATGPDPPSTNQNVVTQEELDEYEASLLAYQANVAENLIKINKFKDEVAIVEPVEMLKKNPEFDENIAYVPRAERKEWTPVGIIGKVFVKDDGTCQVGQKCDCTATGIATTGSMWHVLSRNSSNVVRIMFHI